MAESIFIGLIKIKIKILNFSFVLENHIVQIFNPCVNFTMPFGGNKNKDLDLINGEDVLLCEEYKHY